MVNQEILSQIKNLEIDCPDCEYIYSDEQYMCTMCWCEGGQGKINLFNFLIDNPEYMEEFQRFKFYKVGIHDAILNELVVHIFRTPSNWELKKVKGKILEGKESTIFHIEEIDTIYSDFELH